MIKFRSKANALLFLAIFCSSGVLLPAEGFANLNSMACRAIKRGCYDGCNGGTQSQACYDQCRNSFIDCVAAGANPTTNKQQDPAPQPCKGLHCTLLPPPKTTDPTAPRHPITTAKPTAPFKPVGNSNPSGPSNPVIFERQNGSGGAQSGGHEIRRRRRTWKIKNAHDRRSKICNSVRRDAWGWVANRQCSSRQSPQ